MAGIDQAIAAIIESGGAWAALLIIVGFWGWSNQKKVSELQELRVQDNRNILEAMKDSSHAAEKAADALTELSRRLERLGGS